MNYTDFDIKIALFVGYFCGYSMYWCINRLPVIIHEKKTFGRVLRKNEVAYLNEDGNWTIIKECMK